MKVCKYAWWADGWSKTIVVGSDRHDVLHGHLGELSKECGQADARGVP